MNDLSTFGKKLEEIIGHELDNLMEYIVKHFSLSKIYEV